MERKGYTHQVTFLRGKKKTPSELMPRVHQIIYLLKGWLIRTHQGVVRHKYIDYYLDEFTFRFNGVEASSSFASRSKLWSSILSLVTGSSNPNLRKEALSTIGRALPESRTYALSIIYRPHRPLVTWPCFKNCVVIKRPMNCGMPASDLLRVSSAPTP